MFLLVKCNKNDFNRIENIKFYWLETATAILESAVP